MMPVRLLVLLTLMLVGGLPGAAQGIAGTQGLITTMVAEAYQQIIDSLDHDTVRVEFSGHPDAPWLQAQFLSSIHRAGKTLVTDQAPIKVHVVPSDVSTRYEGVEDADSIRRIVTVQIQATLEADGRIRVISPEVRADTIVCMRKDALAAESAQHQSTRGEMPDPSRTVWDDVLEPAIFVVAAVATVVLLFTVRSQ